MAVNAFGLSFRPLLLPFCAGDVVTFALDSFLAVAQPEVCRLDLIGIPGTCDSVSNNMRTDCYRAPCRLWCRRFSIGTLLLRRGVPCRTSGMLMPRQPVLVRRM